MKEWAPYIALVTVFVVSTGYMTLTLNGRMAGLESRMDSLDQRIEGLEVRLDGRIVRLESKIDRLDAKFDRLDAKFDELLLALAGRGVIVSAKPNKSKTLN